MKSRYGLKFLWVILAFGVLLASWPSRAQGPFALRSKKMDTQDQKICDQYDATFSKTVSSNWFNLLDSKPADYDRGRGKVTLKFILHSNGQVTDMKIVKSSVSVGDADLCEKAVLSGAPYQTWSEEIRKAVGTNCLAVSFRFDYK